LLCFLSEYITDHELLGTKSLKPPNGIQTSYWDLAPDPTGRLLYQGQILDAPVRNMATSR